MLAWEGCYSKSLCGRYVLGFFPKVKFSELISWFKTGGGGTIALKGGEGMCHGHDPLFLGQSTLPSLPIYHQCAAHVAPPPIFNI